MARPRKDGTPSKEHPYTGGRPEKYTSEWIEQEADALLEWIKEDSPKNIYLGSFALQRGYCRQMLSDFAKKSKIFYDAYKQAKSWQEEKFMRNGLTKEWDPGFTFLCMARVQGDEWKKSWDQPEERADATINININKI